MQSANGRSCFHNHAWRRSQERVLLHVVQLMIFAWPNLALNRTRHLPGGSNHLTVPRRLALPLGRSKMAIHLQQESTHKVMPRACVQWIRAPKTVHCGKSVRGVPLRFLLLPRSDACMSAFAHSDSRPSKISRSLRPCLILFDSRPNPALNSDPLATIRLLELRPSLANGPVSSGVRRRSTPVR